MIPKDVFDANTDYVNLLTNDGEIILNMRDICRKVI